MDREEVVRRYLDSLSKCVQGAREWAERAHPALRGHPLRELMYARGRAIRQGLIDRLGSYHLHGAGCRFELASGEEVDFDWHNDREVFDGWRLASFARSLGHTFDSHELSAVARSRVGQGLTEVRPGWFAPTDELAYDLLNDQMASAIPTLQEAYAHEQEWWGEQAPPQHVRFGSVLNPHLSQVLSTDDQAAASDTFDFLERMAVSSDPRVRDVLRDTVLEHLRDEPLIHRQRAEDLMGPATTLPWRDLCRGDGCE